MDIRSRLILTWGALLLVTCVSMTAIPPEAVTIDHHWDKGFTGKFCVWITEELHGWDAHLVFSDPVDNLEVFTANVVEVSKDRKEYIVESKYYNADEHIGNQLCVSFTGHTKTDIIPTATVYIGPRKAHDPMTTTQSPDPLAVDTIFHVPLKITGSFKGGFEAQFCSQLPEYVHGWEATLVFSDPLTKLEASAAEVVGHSSDRKSYLIVNPAERADIQKNDGVCVRLKGYTTNTYHPTAMVYFRHLSPSHRPTTPSTTPSPYVTKYINNKYIVEQIGGKTTVQLGGFIYFLRTTTESHQTSSQLTKSSTGSHQTSDQLTKSSTRSSPTSST